MLEEVTKYIVAANNLMALLFSRECKKCELSLPCLSMDRDFCVVALQISKILGKWLADQNLKNGEKENGRRT